MFSVESAPFFFVLFLVSFDGFILIHMSHFVNTNFVFSCYFSVLFYHECQLLVFISQSCHLISLFTIVHTLSTPCKLLLGTYARTATNPQPELHFSPVIFLANLPIFQYNHDIGAFWHLLLYMQAIFSHLTGSCDSHVQFFR